MLHFLPLLPIILLLISSLAVLILRVIRPKFGYFWLIAALGALAAWPAQLISLRAIPAEIELVAWQPGAYFPLSPALLLDKVSWPYALALISLVLAVLLTDVARAAEGDWLAWASNLALTALGLSAVLAGNPLTLILAWAVLDLAEVLIMLSETLKSAAREQILIAYAARLAGIFALIIATITASAGGQPLTFENIPSTISPLLLLAAGLRLGVLPLHLPVLEQVPLRRGLGTLLNLVPAATSLTLLTRTASAGTPDNLAPFLLTLTGLAALYAGISWLTAANELDGRPYWILGLASLAMAAAIRTLPEATLAWGMTALLSGGLLFFMSARHNLLNVIAGLGFLGLLGLPNLPSWQSVELFGSPSSPLLAIFWFAQIMFAAGYLLHLSRPGDRLAGVERWVWVIYPWGLILLPATHILITIWGLRQPGGQLPDLVSFWPNVLALLVMAAGLLLYQRGIRFPDRVTQSFRRTLSLRWLYRIAWQLYRLGARTVAFVNVILEGEGGILWTLLLLVVLLALLAQQGLGG